jgi:hypothetical protein
MTEDLLTNVRQQLEERIEELRDAVEERDRLQANLRALEAEPWVLDAELTRPVSLDAEPEVPDTEPATADAGQDDDVPERPDVELAAPVTAEAGSAAMISGQQTLDVELGMLAADPGPQEAHFIPPAADSEPQEAADAAPGPPAADPGPPAADPGSLEADPTPPAADPEPQEAVDADPAPPANVVPLPVRSEPASELALAPEPALVPEPELASASVPEPALAPEPAPAPAASDAAPAPALESEPTPESAPAPAPEPSLESEPTPEPAPEHTPAVSPKIARLMSAPRRPALERSGIARVGGRGGRADASVRRRVDEDEPPDEIYEQAI